MVSDTDVAKIYETVLSIPGMNDNVKIALNIPRKNVLLLSRIIEKGLSVKDPGDKPGVLDVISKEMMQELKTLPAELLDKAGLTETNQKLQAF